GKPNFGLGWLISVDHCEAEMPRQYYICQLSVTFGVQEEGAAYIYRHISTVEFFIQICGLYVFKILLGLCNCKLIYLNGVAS
ncbi:hypothetical protein LDP07_24905, partial [Ralstonia pseudosolanacearum]|uniref:hypothetical protein n=1 Tax=Ralstonia pseudosolanacearum TaxID=1310165 RepID=UPI003CED5CD2